MRNLVLAVLAMTLSALSPRAAADGITGKLIDGQAWRCIGPAVVGGRIDDVAVVESDTTIAYVATATAGLWKTTNHGVTFSPIFDDQPCQSIGAVAVSRTDPNIVWVGTGEANNRQSSSWGCGVFKSVDAGKTWQHMGLPDSLHIPKIAIHPTNPDIVYVAALGHLWGPNEERGLYKTVDGGKTWVAVLKGNADTGCQDVVLDPANPEIVYASLYQRRRAAWGFIGGGPHGGVFRSRDGGGTWTKLQKGLPAGDIGCSGLDVYRRNPRIVYAIVEARDGGVFRSEDGGDSWTRMSSTNPRPMYFSLIRIDPNDDQTLWIGGVSFMRSRDGGKTFAAESGARLHADIHAIWIDPADSRHMLVGCDGGIQWSYDRGRTWDHVNTIPLAQFYGLGYDMQIPYNLAGGLQDNGSWLGPSSHGPRQGPTNASWQNLGSGDGFLGAIAPDDPNTVYTESQNGNVRRSNAALGTSVNITPSAPPGEPPYRWDWCTPFMISPHRSSKILLGGNRLFLSTDRGDTWRRTQDLSTNPDITQFELMGVKRGKAYPFPDLGSDYGQIVTISESPLKEGILYVGTDDGNLQVSRDDGRTWTNVVRNLPGVTGGIYVSRVHASIHRAGRVYASLDNHRADDYRPYVFVSEDYGATWRSISNGIPIGSTVNVIREHPQTPNLLFAGTDRGLYVSFDRGLQWSRFGKPLPPLRVDEVLIHPRENDLIVATHARGVYILDDIGSLVAAANGVSGRMALFPPAPAVMYRGTTATATLTGNRQYDTQGEPTGARIHYWLAEEPTLTNAPELTILTSHGQVVTRRRLTLANAGYNVTTWDFREDLESAAPTTTMRAASSDGTAQDPRSSRPAQRSATGARRPSRSIAQRGTRVLPGGYRVRLQLGDAVQEQRLTVIDDPRIRLSRRERATLIRLIRDMNRRAVLARRADDRAQALETALKTSAESDPVKNGPESARIALKEMQNGVAALRNSLAGRTAGPTAGALVQTLGAGGQIVEFRSSGNNAVSARLARYAMRLDSISEMPSRGLRAEMETLMKESDRLIREADELSGRALVRLNTIFKKAKLPELVLQPSSEEGGSAESVLEVIGREDGTEVDISDMGG